MNKDNETPEIKGVAQHQPYATYRDSDGHDHDCIRCDLMADTDCDTKHPGERGTCCVCVGHGCDEAQAERRKHPVLDSTALFAVRVLTHQGHNDTAEDDLIPHLREISARYSELKRTHDFMTSSHIAKAEWLARFLLSNTSDQATASK